MQNNIKQLIPTLLNELPDNHPTALGFATGVAVGFTLQLPPSNQMVDEAFNDAIVAKTQRMISEINEVSVIDTEYTEQVTIAVYRVRYNALYPKAVVVSPDECICCDVFAISQYFADIDTNIFQQHKTQIAKLIDALMIHFKPYKE